MAVKVWRSCFGLALGWMAAALTAGAQTLPPAESPARDLNEEVVHIEVTVRDLNRRQETMAMPITIYRPSGPGPFPLVVFNHGRAVKDKRAQQGRSKPENFARYMVAKGFVVLAPTRIGYWETYGSFDPENSGSCNDPRLEPMSVAASDQVLAAVSYARTLPYVDASRWIVAGQSVGGLVSVATVGRNPPGLIAGINFAGGTGGNPEVSPGRPCSPGSIERYWGTLAKDAKAPMLWFYWPNDKFWGEEIPKRWFKAWTDGGARAEFKTYEPTGSDGHQGVNTDMDHWVPELDRFLARLGFDKPAITPRPARSGYAEVGDMARLPAGSFTRPSGYAKFLDSKLPRAFAIGERGGWGYASGDYAMGRALGFCQRGGQTCHLYAVDDDVVWAPK